MAAANINRVIITGNLTSDPEVKSLPSGSSVCRLRVAVNTRRKTGDEWVDYANFFDVTVFGRAADNAGQYLAKGRPVAVDGRLEWREWEKDGQKRQAVGIVADTVQYLNSREGAPAASTAPAADQAADVFDDGDVPF